MEELGENVSDISGVTKGVCMGHFLLYGFTKKPADFLAVAQLIKVFLKEGGDMEEP